MLVGAASGLGLGEEGGRAFDCGDGGEAGAGERSGPEGAAGKVLFVRGRFEGGGAGSRTLTRMGAHGVAVYY